MIKHVIIKLYLIKLRILFRIITNQTIVTTIWDVIIAHKQSDVFSGGKNQKP